jgi:D-threo-aldose 1-dehydrogenase
LSTKVGRLVRPVGAPARAGVDPPAETYFDFSAPGTVRSLEESLERLGLERVDVAFIHDPDDHHEQALAETYPALVEFRERSLVGAIGVGMNRSEPLARFARQAAFDCLLVAGRYTLLDQSALDDLLPVAEGLGVSILAGGAFNSGVLANPRRGATFDYAPAPAGVVARAGELARVCDGFGVPMRAAALRFPLGHPAVTSVVAGPGSAKEVDDLVDLWTTEIPDELWAALRERGFLREDAPAPPSP